MTQQDKRSFSADALAALASGGPPPLAGQDAPAQGVQPPPPPLPDGAALVDPFAALAAAPAPTAQAPAAPPPAIANFSAPTMSVEARRVRSIQQQKRTAQQHGHTFRQVAIPLLLAVGAILFVMATIVLIKLPRETLEGDVTLMNSPWAPWLVLAAYLVGAVLFLGAFLFHAEVQQAKMKMKRAQAQAVEEDEEHSR